MPSLPYSWNAGSFWQVAAKPTLKLVDARLAAILEYPRMLRNYDEFIYAVWSVYVSQSLVPKSESRLGFQKVLWVLFRTPHVSHVHPQCKWKVAVETLQGFLKHSDSFSSTNFRCTSFNTLNSMIKVRNEKRCTWNILTCLWTKGSKGPMIVAKFRSYTFLGVVMILKIHKGTPATLSVGSDLRSTESGS